MQRLKRLRVFLASVALAGMLIIGSSNSVRGGDCIIAACDIAGDAGFCTVMYCVNCNTGVSICQGYSYSGCLWYGLWTCKVGGFDQ
ncbi:MAG: hypothetical protein ACREDR_19950 [Blastocatellia bacterium]